MISFAHYDPRTGIVRQYVRSASPHGLSGRAVALFRNISFDAAVAGSYIVDLRSVGMGEDGWNYCLLLPVAHEPGPTVREVRAARNVELAETDAMMLPDRNVADRIAWRSYRQALRDLGALGSADEMIAAWPRRPDGHDPIESFRSGHA
jgi:hypothetical protein